LLEHSFKLEAGWASADCPFLIIKLIWVRNSILWRIAIKQLYLLPTLKILCNMITLSINF
jgi:hypothetical protein